MRQLLTSFNWWDDLFPPVDCATAGWFKPTRCFGEDTAGGNLSLGNTSTSRRRLRQLPVPRRRVGDIQPRRAESVAWVEAPREQLRGVAPKRIPKRLRR